MKICDQKSTLIALCLLVAGAVCSALFATRASAQTRAIRVINAAGAAGADVSVTIELTALGSENAVGFSLNFNSAILGNPRAALGGGATGATLNANANQAAQGRFGIALALPSDQTFAAGARQLVVVTFAAAGGAAMGTTPITFGDQPVTREVAAANAATLPCDFVAGAVTIAGALANVSAASFAGAQLAPESIVAAFGSKLATATEVASSLPLPTQLAGTTVKVKAGAGAEQLAQLFFVSSGQVNYLFPSGSGAGLATVTITGGDGSISIGTAQSVTVAPGLFTANANGQGVVSGVALRVRSGVQTFEPIAQFDSAQNRFTPLPIDLGIAGDEVYLIIFGTGFRNRSALSAVSVKIGGTDIAVSFAAAAPNFIGLDQLNLGPLPRSLAGRGELDTTLMVDGKAANTVKVAIK